MSDLGTLGGTESYAYGINDAGVVVGWATTADTKGHAFRYSGGVMTDLGTLGGWSSLAMAINSAGDIVGAAQPANSKRFRPFLYRDEVMTDLGTLGGGNGYATALNNVGQIVGYEENLSYTDSRAFLYNGGVLQDLNDLLPANSGWVLQKALGINDRGQIVGQGLLDGTPYGFVMLPTGTVNLVAADGGSAEVSPYPGPYPIGFRVVLTAVPAEGYSFTGWTIDGASVGVANPYSLVIAGDHLVRPAFAPIPPAQDKPVSPPSTPPQDCSVYSCWASRGGILTDSPAAASFKGRTYVFARGTNFGSVANPEYPLFVKSTADGANFSGWTNLGGNLTGAPAAVATSTRLYVFAKGTDDALYVKSSLDGVNFGEWKRLGGLLTAPPAAATVNGVVYVFAKGSDDALYVKQAVDGGTFGEWMRLGGLLTAGPASVGFSGSVYVYAKGADDALYVRRLTNGKPSTDWLRLGGLLTAAPAAATVGGKLYVFANGSDSGLYVKTSTNGLAYGDWTPLGGTLKPGATPAATGVGSRVFAFVWWVDDALWERHTPK